MTDPGLPNASANPEPGKGAVLVGSGKVGKPWPRMHSDSLSIATFWLSDARPPPGPPPGSKRKHALCADWNAGDWGLIPEPAVIWIPPPPPGSGKLGTPWERMQSANSIPADALTLDRRRTCPQSHTRPAPPHSRQGASVTAMMRWWWWSLWVALCTSCVPSKTVVVP
jgi:hypothetical protein